MRAFFLPINDASFTCYCRYLDTGFWSLEAGGTPLTNAIESTVRWREEVAPHLITDTDVRGRDAGGYFTYDIVGHNFLAVCSVYIFMSLLIGGR